MGIVVMAYAKDALKEYYLPALNDANYVLAIDGSSYGLNCDLRLNMEVVHGSWYFLDSQEYNVTDYNRKEYDGKKLEDGDLYLVKTSGNERLSLIIAGAADSLQVMHKFSLKGLNSISIGNESSCDIQYVFMSYISKNHAYLQRQQSAWFVTDVSSNGTFIEGKRAVGSRQLAFGDCINIYGLKIVFLDDFIAVCGQSYVSAKLHYTLKEYSGQPHGGNHKAEKLSKKTFYKRSPRQLEKIYDEPVAIDAPPAAKHTKQKPLFLTIGPAFTMAIPMLLGSMMAILGSQSRTGAYMFTGIITAIGSAGFGVFWALNNIKYTRNMEREEENHRYNAYGQYLIDIANFLKEKYQYNMTALNNTYISSQQCIGYDENNPNLWNRNRTHDDFLAVRLGIGSMDFQVEVTVPEKKFSLVADELAGKPEEIKNSYATLFDVPVCIDLLKYNMVGVVGGDRLKGAKEVILNIVSQIAVNNCYTDVKLVFLYDEKKDAGFWEFAKWLPHVWSDGKKCRFIASNKEEMSDVSFELSKILREREGADAHASGQTCGGPHFVVIVENLELLEGELLAKYIMAPQSEYGLTTILMVEQYEQLPNVCEEIIENDSKYMGMYNVTESMDKMSQIRFDSISSSDMEFLARKLSKIEVNEVSNGGEMPSSLDFFEMYDVADLEGLNVLERWTKNRTYDSMKALIGKKGGNTDCYLDIHEKYHGPHGLVAGTTGSGKSETLQTYMLSLAVNFSPYDIGFFIIDFKGGGMANLFSNLPHLVGKISNLSGNQVRRAMISIKSENMRRQRIFSEHSVNNINLYTRLYKNHEAKIPVPHLFIIIDEFAELKREEPEFMKELISVAQVGRSLGVHLILATQKPSGTVDDNIWSNTKFRLCLRVQDRQDSNDMLHKPDAAYITQAGRCYLQVGNDEIYELFQSGYSGAAYDPDMAVGKTSIATMITKTGKTAIVGNRTKKKKKDAQKQQWFTELIEIILDNIVELDYSIAEVKHEEQKMSEICQAVIENLEYKDIDYENSPGNIARLQELIKLIPDDTQRADTAAEEVVKNGTGKRLPEIKEKTQLDAVVEYLGQVAHDNGYEYNLSLWLPVLPKELYLENLEGYQENAFDGNQWKKRSGKWSLAVPVGLYDDPENQAQNPFVINMAESGHLAVCGTVATGKSTFLQTLVYALMTYYTPEQVQFYMLDYSSRQLVPFENAPHTGGVMVDSDEEKVKKFFHMLESIMDERKKLFTGGNYSQYIRAHGMKVPAIVLVVDNYANFNEKTEGHFDKTMVRVAKEGVGYGIFLAASSGGFGMNEIPGRIADNIRTVVTLDMGDKFKYADVLRITHIPLLPEADVKGRGLAVINGNILEYHTALCIEAEDDYRRGERIVQQIERMNRAWKGSVAQKIPEIPEKPVLSEFKQLSEYKRLSESDRFLPVGYHMEDASIYSVDLSKTYCYLINGKARTGKTNMLKMIVYAAAERKNAHIVIIENTGSELKTLSESVGAQYLTSEEEIYNFFKGTIPVFKSRNAMKHECIKKDMEEQEIYRAIQSEEHYYIFIADIITFIHNVYHPENLQYRVDAYLENITEKGFLHNIFFFGCVNTDEVTRAVGLKIYSNMMSYKTGIHLGGYINSQKLFQFTNIPFAQQSKPMKTGLGLIPSAEDSAAAQQVVIPLAKGK